MNLFGYMALVGWVPLVCVLFWALEPRRAALVSLIGGWLFLPESLIDFHGFPDYSKELAVGIAPLLGAALFDPRFYRNLKYRWFDVFALVVCFSPVVSSVLNAEPTNELGWYDGVSNALTMFAAWGGPYILGRIYFSDFAGLRMLCGGILLGGILYLPLCWWELRMGPSLHYHFYGFSQHQFLQHVRGGGYRPKVFLSHGLMTGLWMVNAALAGLCLWWLVGLRKFKNVPMLWVVSALLVTAILCKSMLAIGLMFLGVVGIAGLCFFRSRAGLWLMLLFVPVYIALRLTGHLPTQTVLNAVPFASEDRLSSLETRLRSEEYLMERAVERPVFGWGRWVRYQPNSPAGSFVRTRVGWDKVIAEARWIMVFGQYGTVGLVAMSSLLLLPVGWFLGRSNFCHFAISIEGWPIVLCMMLLTFSVDCLFNDMVSPVYLASSGALLGWLGAGCRIDPASPDVRVDPSGNRVSGPELPDSSCR